jgi:hypothetical protein
MSNTNTKKTTLEITFSLAEIKQLVIDHIDDAQDTINSYCLSKCKKYDIWHEPLNKFYKEKKGSNPRKVDKLCFVILLSYPKHIIERMNNISDIKLFSHDSDYSDFNHKAPLGLNCEQPGVFHRYDCVCSQKKLLTVHIVENKHSGIYLQVGSCCIKNHRILSKEEFKKFEEAEKFLEEKKREIKEGKPIGYYKEEKNKKAEEKNKKAEEKNKKAEEKIKTGNYKRCYYCDTNIVNTKTNKLYICKKCKNKNYEELCCAVKKLVKKQNVIKCENCEIKFVDRKQEGRYLCVTCETQYKIIKCCERKCSRLLIVDKNEDDVDKNEDDVYCYDCEKNLAECIDCKEKFIQEKSESRCKSCQFNYENKIVIRMCVVCNEEILVEEKNSWKIYCPKCYRETKDILKNPPKCRCGLRMSERTIKKEGANKGRKALGCAKYPNGCKDFQML